MTIETAAISALGIFGFVVSVDNLRLRLRNGVLVRRLVNSVAISQDVNVLESGMVLPAPEDPRWVFSGLMLSIGEVRINVRDGTLSVAQLARDSDRAKAYVVAVKEAYQQRRALAAIEGAP